MKSKLSLIIVAVLSIIAIGLILNCDTITDWKTIGIIMSIIYLSNIISIYTFKLMKREEKIKNDPRTGTYFSVKFIIEYKIIFVCINILFWLIIYLLTLEPLDESVVTIGLMFPICSNIICGVAFYEIKKGNIPIR